MMSEHRLPASPAELVRGNAKTTISGDSMHPTAGNGETLIFAKTEYANDNDLVVVSIANEVLIKRITYTHDEILLNSDNPKYPTMHCKHEEISVIGKAIKVCGLLCLLFY